ncbi:MAG: site-specific integrase, partial [Acidobacteriia bacterium]|nr:site-specific integrase [Terriglobia bacterium]
MGQEYTNHLREVRGFAASTVSSHRRTAQCFLQHLKEVGTAVGCIEGSNIESYIAQAGTRLSRASLQHDIAALRGFLRFLSTDGRAPTGLDRQIDTPRLYRLEQLPRALSWDTVRTLLRSVDMTSPMGLLSRRSWKGTVLWKHFQHIKERFPLMRPKLYLPYSELQA